jgi:uncharacterized membrane protein
MAEMHEGEGAIGARKAEAWRRHREDRDAPDAPPAPTPVNTVRPTTPDAPRAPVAPTLDLESLIGGRWFAVGGALIFVVGVGLLVRLAVAEGWFGGLPAWAKCATGAALGLALIGAGEGLRRRVNAWALVGLNAAGIGALFAAAYAVYGVYTLVGAPTAMMLFGLCTAAGVAVAVRHRLGSLAVVALLGGYLAPILMADDAANPVVTPLSLAALFTVGVGLGVWARAEGRRRDALAGFEAARALAWVASLVLGTWWIVKLGVWSGVERSDGAWVLAAAWLGFIVYLWTVVHAQAILAASRSPVELVGSAWIVPAAVTTGWGVLLAMNDAVAPALGMGRWVPAAVGAILTASAGFALLAGESRSTTGVLSARGRFAAVLLVEAACLLILAVALSISGWLQTGVWLAMGVAAVFGALFLARDERGTSTLPTRALGLYGIMLLILGSGRVFLVDLADPTLTAARWDAAAAWGLVLSRWTLLVALAGVAWTAAGAAALAAAPKLSAAFGGGMIALGACLVLASIAHADAAGASVVLVWLLAAWVLAGLALLLPRGTGESLGWASGAVGFAAAVVLFCIAPRDFSRGITSEDLFLPVSLAGVLVAGLAALAIVHARPALERIPAFRGSLAALTLAAACVLVLGTLLPASVESYRVAFRLSEDATARRAAVSLCGALYAAFAVGVGFWRRIPAARVAGLALMGLAGLKVLIVDFAGASLFWRTLSFLVVGFLMLGVAVLYGWLARAASPKPDAEEGASPA